MSMSIYICSRLSFHGPVLNLQFPSSPLPVCLNAAGHGEMVQRILDILRFLWAIVLAMVDGLTQWLNLLTKQYRETSTVLCNERYSIIHKIQQVKTQHNPTQSDSQTNTLSLSVFNLCPSDSITHWQTTRCLWTVRVPLWRPVWTRQMQKTPPDTGQCGKKCVGHCHATVEVVIALEFTEDVGKEVLFAFHAF